ncbi:RNA polymerase sigma factor [Desulfomonile tiedjei]|uniref:RNA polymerase sigma factor n=1 Tax=Desulfomonile tiedjei TaxID=2358 RepID=UPI0012F825FE|nr:sigma-70 family RNA polymerase sigma factor [Desulfomonile tiedjei]
MEKYEVSGAGSDVRDLVNACNRGDRDSWQEFYSRYLPLVHCAVRRFAPSDELEDLSQEVFIQLFKALRSFDEEKSLEAFIMEIARRVAISGFRRATAFKRGGPNRNRHVDISQNGDLHHGLCSSASAENQETLLIRAEEMKFLRFALDAISEACKKLLGFRYDQGLSYQEISALLGTKEATLRVQVARCLSALSTHYGKVASMEDLEK